MHIYITSELNRFYFFSYILLQLIANMQTYFLVIWLIQKFCSNLKGLEIVGQIVIYNDQSQINAWKKCFHVERENIWSNLLKMYKVFCLKELSGAINWKQLSGGQLFGDNHRDPNCPGRGYLAGGNCLAANYLGSNFLVGGNFPWREQLSGGQSSVG